MTNVTVPFLFFLEEFLTTASLHLKKAQPLTLTFIPERKAYYFPMYWTDGNGTFYESTFEIEDVGKKLKLLYCKAKIGKENKELMKDVNYFLCSMGNYFSKAWDKQYTGKVVEGDEVPPEHYKTLFKTI